MRPYDLTGKEPRFTREEKAEWRTRMTCGYDNWLREAINQVMELTGITYHEAFNLAADESWAYWSKFLTIHAYAILVVDDWINLPREEES